MIENTPLYCCLLLHGVKDQHPASEAAFRHWVEAVDFYNEVSWVHDADAIGFPRFHVTVLVSSRQPEGFLQRLWHDSLIYAGFNPVQAGDFSERYLTWQELFVNEKGIEEPEQHAG